MKRVVCSVLLFLSCFAGSAPAQEPVRLSLGEAIRMAAERNLDVRAELYTPAQNEADIRFYQSIYDPLLNLSTQYTNAPQTLAGEILPRSNSHSFQLNSSLSQQLWTGGAVRLGFDNTYFSSNPGSTFPTTVWQSQAGVTLTQPLLKGFGRENTELNINVSRLTKFASLEQFRNRLMATVSQVKIEYFKLYLFREQLTVRRVSLDLARQILVDTKARVSAGVLPAMEILNAEFGVTSREKDLIDAEKAVNDQLDVLRLLLQVEGNRDIILTDLPQRSTLSMDEETSIRRALSRPDIKSLKRTLDINELETRIFNSNIKPELSLVASGFLQGSDRAYDRNLEKLGGFDNPGWSVGLNFSYPLGNNAAWNSYRKSRLKTEQVALQIRSLEENAIRDVKTAIRLVNSSYKQLDVSDRGRAYAEERLRAFIRKNEVGLATTKDVLDVENDLANAKNNQISAAVTYANAITQYWFSTGELLDREGVRMVEGDADRLYANVR